MRLIVSAFVLSFGIFAKADLLHIQTKSRVNLVELYSSEGCSSCPPADRWLSSLKSNSGLWKRFVPVEFHVDYWNDIGWKDPFSQPGFTHRQWEYAEIWGNQNVYTPGVVFNGEEWTGWRKGDGSKLLEEEGGGGNGNIEVNEISKRNFKVKFTPSVQGSAKDYVIYAALLGNGISSQVKSGENSGEALKHDFVVLELKKMNPMKDGKIYSASFEFPKQELNFKVSSYSVAFWITGQKHLPILATGSDLNN